MSKKITLTENNIPKYFIWDDDYYKVDEKTFIRVFSHEFGYDIDVFENQYLSHFHGEEVEPITKAEFVAHCNKAYKAITGFKHVEELWKDEEGDAHE